jgi:hypothetical protein
MALLWVLNYSDGCHTLLDIAVRAAMSFPAMRQVSVALQSARVLAPPDGREPGVIEGIRRGGPWLPARG